VGPCKETDARLGAGFRIGVLARHSPAKTQSSVFVSPPFSFTWTILTLARINVYAL